MYADHIVLAELTFVIEKLPPHLHRRLRRCPAVNMGERFTVSVLYHRFPW